MNLARHKKSPDLNRLILDNLGLASKIARDVQKHLPSRCAFEDIEGWARVGLVEAAQSWDSRRGKFASYAWKIIRGMIWDHYRRANYQNDVTSQELPESPSYTPDFDRAIDAANAERLASELPQDSRDVIRMQYREERQVREIALQLHVTPGRVCQIRKHALQQIFQLLQAGQSAA